MPRIVFPGNDRTIFSQPDDPTQQVVFQEPYQLSDFTGNMLYHFTAQRYFCCGATAEPAF
jgi:hypothetical protein